MKWNDCRRSTEIPQQIHQLRVPLGSDTFGKLSFVLLGQVFDFGQRLFTFRSQVQ